MILIKRRLTIAMLTLAIVFPLPARAHGSPCEGIWMVGCLIIAPFLAAGFAVEMVIADVAKNNRKQKNMIVESVQDELRAGEFDKFKALVERQGILPSAEALMADAVSSYLGADGLDKDEARTKIIQYLLAKKVDVAGENGTFYLQQLVIGIPQFNSEEDSTSRNWPRRLQLAKLLFAHGAKATNVDLSLCSTCNQNSELLQLMIAHGADLNRQSAPIATPSERSLNAKITAPPAYSVLESKLNNGQFSEARALVNQGVDPNGVIHSKRGMLYRLAANCNLNEMRPRMSPTLFELEVGSCTNRIEFAIELGADPNGKATPDVDCTTPYEIAIKLENDALAKKLLELGATADFGERCRAGGI